MYSRVSVLRRVSLLSVLAVAGLGASGQAPVVRAVFFYSPTCPHCHTVIRDDLPGLFERYGGPGRVWYDAAVPQQERAFYLVSNGQLEILLVNVAQPEGSRLYQAATEALGIPEERQGVPRLVIEDSVLVGSFEIPTYLPTLIEAGRCAGGIDWPAISGLELALSELPRPPLAAAESEAEEENEEPEVTEAPASPGAADVTTDAKAPARAKDDSAAIPAEPLEESAPEVRREATAPATEAPVREEEVREAGLSEPSGEKEPPSASRVEETQPHTSTSPSPEGADVAEEGAAIPEASGSREDPTPGADDDLELLTESRPSMLDLYRRDTVGNTLSVIVLLGMLMSLGGLPILFRAPTPPRRPGWSIPVVAILGAAVAVYLTYVESSGAQAVCGPVGDCNAVQGSEYARLFGVVPVGAIGLVGYIAILAAWSVGRLDAPVADWGRLSLLVFGIVGVVFSIYLTYLEPFVIGATCAWCLTSALAVTLLMWLSARPGLAAWRRLTRSAG